VILLVSSPSIPGWKIRAVNIVLVLILIIGLAALSAVLNLWQWAAACCFKFRGQSSSNNALEPPGVSLLKPLKGCDSETAACLESWFLQNYGGSIQILFGVASPLDPVVEIVDRLIAKYPNVAARLVMCEKTLGANAKVSTLVQLEALVTHRYVIISDADVFVPAAFIAQTMNDFSNPDIGMVNSFYRLENPSTLAMQWEAIAINADFWSQVLQGNLLKKMDFALGAVMAIRAESLKTIGGFASLADFLADDYQLGHKIAASGSRITIGPSVARCFSPKMGWDEVWNHQLRWARTIRFCQPVPWFFSILSNATIWPLLAVILLRDRMSFVLAGVALLLRVCTALHNQARLTNRIDHIGYFWLVPVKDLLHFALWAGSFLGSTVIWRGIRYRVLSGGRLVTCK
jgi:ceramide glucosyltransferase